MSGGGTCVVPRWKCLLLLILLLARLTSVEAIGCYSCRLSLRIRLWLEFQRLRLANLLAFSKLFQYVKIKDDNNSGSVSVRLGNVFFLNPYLFPFTWLALYDFNRTKQPFLSLLLWTT